MKFLKIILFLSCPLSATETIFKFGITNFSGTITSSTKTFDRVSGTLFVGSDNTGGGDGGFALASASRTSTSFSPIGTDDLLSGERILGISILRNGGVDTSATHLASLTETNSSEVIILKLSNNSVEQSGLLTDGDGSVSDGASLITTSSQHVFARVTRAAGNEGAGNGSGIANIQVTADSPSIIQGSTTSALTFDGTSLDGALSQVVTDMAFDEDLTTLFITSSAQVASTSSGFALRKAKFGIGSGGGEIGLQRARLSDLTPRSEDLTTIFGRTTGGSAGAIGLHKVRVMTTSTDLKYLIVNGGVFSGSSIAGNLFHSLRISQTGSGSIRTGDVIRFDRSLETQLPDDFTNVDNVLSATVGSGTAPWSNTVTCSDMVVIDDAVYVSGVVPQRDDTNDPGIWKSQAMFDHDGKIVAWTPWERVFPSVDNTDGDNTPFFEVDARNGKIWRGNNSGDTITRTKWNTNSSSSSSLQSRIASLLNDGCYTVLDLPTDTPGVGSSTSLDNSITVFSGFEKVVFARTKNGNSNAITTDFSIDDNIRSTTDSDGLSGFGPIRSLGYSYNNEPGSTKGYFFAGTNKGLLAYAPSDGSGFNGNTGITDLNSSNAGELFGTGEDASWQRVASSILTSTSAVSQIITCSGDRTYLLVLDTVTQNGITDHLYEMELEDTVAALSPRVIASSGRGGLPTNAVLSGCTVITTTNSQTGISDRVGCFGVLSTNNGIYTSTCDLHFLTFDDGEWESVITTTGMAFHSIEKIKDHRVEVENTNYLPFKNTSFFALPFIDGNSIGTFENSTFLQAGISSGALPVDAKASLVAIADRSVQASPVNFMQPVSTRKFALNKSTDIDNVEFTTNFFTDGARRFFSRFSPSVSNVFSNIKTLPFNADQWGMSEPDFNKELSSISRIHWIENISGTGQLMAGTDDGVISLE